MNKNTNNFFQKAEAAGKANNTIVPMYMVYDFACLTVTLS